MKGQKVFDLIGMVFEVILLVLLAILPSVLLGDMAISNFGVEVSKADAWHVSLAWLVPYIGILVMLYRNIPNRVGNLVPLSAVVLIELIHGSDILFLKILPEVNWGKTSDLLLFLGGLGLLVGLVLLVFFYRQIHKLFVFEFEDEEIEEEKEEI
jgi:hypothetical protein